MQKHHYGGKGQESLIRQEGHEVTIEKTSVSYGSIPSFIVEDQKELPSTGGAGAQSSTSLQDLLGQGLCLLHQTGDSLLRLGPSHCRERDKQGRCALEKAQSLTQSPTACSPPPTYKVEREVGVGSRRGLGIPGCPQP